MSTKQNAPTTEQFDAYKAMFDHFNAVLFDGSLPDVLLNLSRSRSRTVAFFAPGRWHREDDAKVVTHEISINPRHIAAGNAQETAQSLVHEMVHLWQHVYGTPPRAGYHDREWGRKMIDVGLQPVNAKTGEDCISAPSCNDRVIVGGNFDQAFKKLPESALLPWACVEARKKVAPEGPIVVEGENGEPVVLADPAKPKNKLKYHCPGCGANVWGKPGLQVGCVDLARHADGEPKLFAVSVE